MEQYGEITIQGPYSNFLRLSSNWKHIRITADIQMETIISFFDRYDKYIISQETYPRIHYHIMADISDAGSQNRQLRKLINDNLNIKGNKHLSVTEVRDKERCMQYCIKESDNVHTKNIPEDAVALFKRLAFRKIDGYIPHLIQLEKLYLQDNGLDDYMFLQSYIKLQIQFNRNVYMTHVRAYMLKTIMRKHPEKIQQLANKILSDLEV